MPAFRPVKLDRPSWQWSPRDRSVFRIYSSPTRRARELRERIVPAYRSGVSVSEIAERGKISRAYVHEVLAAESHRDRIVMERFYAGRRNLGRPIDLGGPRDVWVCCDVLDEQEGYW